MILIRNYTKEDFGLWTIFLIFTALIEVSRTSFIQNAYIKYFNETHEKSQQAILNTSSLFLNAISTVVFALFLCSASLWLHYFWESPALVFMLRAYALTSVVLVFFTQYTFMQQAIGDFRGLFWSAAIRQGSFFVLVSMAYLTNLGWPIEYFALAQILCAILGTLVAYFFSRGILVWDSKLNWQKINALFHFGKYKIGTGLSAVLGKNVDQLMLGSILNTATVAVYNSAVRISNFIEMPTLAISTATYPRMAKEIEGENLEKAKFYYEQTVGVLMAVVLPLVAFTLIFTKQLILIIAGPEYLNAVHLTRIILCYTLFIPFNIQFGNISELLGNPKRPFYILLVTTTVNIILNYFWIVSFGTEGAAYATLVSNGLFFVISQFWLNRIIQISYGNIVKFIPDSYFQFYNKIITKVK
jgi:O-antigen/teichoic acid export membrane protein